jgi:hypothetical protein
MVVGMLAGMDAGMALIGRLGRHLLHLGVAAVAAGTIGLALTVTGAETVSAWDLAPRCSRSASASAPASASCSTSSSPA